MAAPEFSRTIPLPPPSRRVSILPAASVLGLAVLTLLIFTVTNAFDSTTVATTTAPVIFGGLPPASSAADTSLFARVVQDGLPPADIASAFIAPRGAARLRLLNTGGSGLGGYDRATVLTVAASRAQLFGFYRTNFTGLGWSLFSSGAAPHGGGDELLFQRAGSDGWWWEAGVIASPTASGKTTFTLRLFQAADAS